MSVRRIGHVTSAWNDERVAFLEVFLLPDECDDDPFLERDLLQHHLMLGESALKRCGA